MSYVPLDHDGYVQCLNCGHEQHNKPAIAVHWCLNCGTRQDEGPQTITLHLLGGPYEGERYELTLRPSVYVRGDELVPDGPVRVCYYVLDHARRDDRRPLGRDFAHLYYVLDETIEVGCLDELRDELELGPGEAGPGEAGPGEVGIRPL